MSDKTEYKERETGDILAKVAKLQEQLYKYCGKLDENATNLGEKLSVEMLEHYYAQYRREYALMNETELIEVDKEIEKLKIKRVQELAAIQLERDNLNNELESIRAEHKRQFEFEKEKIEAEFKIEKDKALGEIQLEHDKIKAEIERKREKLAIEMQILSETADEEARIVMNTIIPESKRRFKLFGIRFGKLVYNQAMNLAFEAAEIQTSEYLMSRAQAIGETQLKYREKYNILPENSEDRETEQEDEAEPMGKRERKELFKRLSNLDDEQRAGVESQIEDLLLSAEGKGNVFEPKRLTEKERRKALNKFAAEDRKEYKTQRKKEKAERKRLKKEAKLKKKKDKAESKEPAKENPVPSGEGEKDKGG